MTTIPRIDCYLFHFRVLMVFLAPLGPLVTREKMVPQDGQEVLAILESLEMTELMEDLVTLDPLDLQ